MGGRFGEMSTFINYTFQSFNFRGRQGARPFYDLVANIAAEEFGHIELVATAINTMLTGSTPTNGRARTSVALRSPLAGVKGLGPECKPHIKRGDHLRLYRFSPQDYLEFAAVFNGPHPETGEELVVVDEAPEGVAPRDLPPQPAVFAPDYAPEELAEIAKKLRQRAGLPKEATGVVAESNGAQRHGPRPGRARERGRLHVDKPGSGRSLPPWSGGSSREWEVPRATAGGPNGWRTARRVERQKLLRHLQRGWGDGHAPGGSEKGLG
jgi:hypothetical protein